MKKIKGIVTLAILFVMGGCSLNEPATFDGADASFMFEENLSASKEDAGVLKLPVVLAGVPGAPSASVKVSVVNDNNSTAIEGVDFTIVNKELSFKEGYGVDTVRINIINNDKFEGDKMFVITLEQPQNAKLGTQKKVLVTIVDDEHPLASILGTFAAADYKLADGAIDGDKYAVSVSAVPGSITQVQISNFWGGGKTILANVDLAQKKISILPGQVIYVHKTYGDCKAVAIDLDAGAYVPTSPIEGTISDTEITFGAWGAKVAVGAFENYAKTVLEKQ